MRADAYVRCVPPGTPALLDDEGSHVTYGELDARVGEAADALAEGGVAAGERLLLVGENTVDMVVALLAAMRAQAWAVPVNPRMAEGEIDAIRAHCEPRLTYFSPASPDALAHGARLGAPAGGWLPCEGRTAAEPVDDVAVMLYTSGSTGTPKGVMLTHANLAFVTQASLDQQVLLPGDRVFHALPVSHSFGLISALLCGLRAGVTLQLCSRFTGERLARAIRDEGITVFQGVPAMYARLLEWSAATGNGLTPNRLRMAYIGGSQVDATRKAQAEALLGLQLHHGYGLTEAAPVVTRTFGHPPPRDVTAGWPIPGIEIALHRGEVCVRGPNVMAGYFRDPEQTRTAIDADGWLHTGDVGRFGPEGDLTIVGRIKEMIIRNGFNVYPAEVEAAIAAYPGVAQCAVLGHAVDGDEEIVAFIEPQAGAHIDTGELAAFLRRRIAPYKIPRHWHVMQRLPASGTGKLLKPALKALLPGIVETA
ncbi:class I adenylate-forming enzyme family protein [Ramlibacter albus]|uniref:AMP-binding protein n=1 Tax=Ramlibacter albus TaxID=2079448 RepID=A0A923S2S0_9BURK|nr:AMP-binding protein [Ramlibacter albus]MBC5765769.1 AMP-binding protein [Ramlibacter albus]